MGNHPMTLKKVILLSIILLITACNMENTKPDSESYSNLEELIVLRQNAEKAYQNDDWAKAIEFYDKLTREVPKDADLWFRLGNAHARLNHPGAALQAYQKALSIDPKNSKIWHNMGIVQLKLATNTFIEMQAYTTPDDPLSIRASHAVHAISKLLQQNFSNEAKE
jgi:tetratricopeptide (TPR) repeat protein